MLRVEQGLQVNVISYSGFEGNCRGACLDLGGGGACGARGFGVEGGVCVCRGEYEVVDDEEEASELEKRTESDCCNFGVCWESRVERGVYLGIGRANLPAERSTAKLDVGGIFCMEETVNNFS